MFRIIYLCLILIRRNSALGPICVPITPAVYPCPNPCPNLCIPASPTPPACVSCPHPSFEALSPPHPMYICPHPVLCIMFPSCPVTRIPTFSCVTILKARLVYLCPTPVMCTSSPTYVLLPPPVLLTTAPYPLFEPSIPYCVRMPKYRPIILCPILSFELLPPSHSVYIYLLPFLLTSVSIR